LILAGSIVGSGELIATTATGAAAGFVLLWLIVIGCVIKVFTQIELGRYTLITGRTTLTALNQVAGPRISLSCGRRRAEGNWILWFWFLMFLASLGQLGGIVGGVGQAVAISLPLTDSGRAFNRALDARVQLQVETARLRLLQDGADTEARRTEVAELQAGLARLRPIVDRHQAQVEAQQASGEARARLQRLESALAPGDQSPFAAQLRRDVEHQRAELGQLDQRLAEVGPPPESRDDKYWAAIIGLATIILLVSGRYRFIEVFSMVLVGTFTLITVGNLIALQGYDEWAVKLSELFSGLSFRLPEASARQQLAGITPLDTALATFGIIGVGAAELVAYPYWCLEKGYARWAGDNDGSEAWATRARGWMRVMHFDAWGSMALYTLATVAFYLLGAAILHRTGLNPQGSEMIRTLSVMYDPVFGPTSKFIFLVGAIAVLYSTFFVANAANTRLAADSIDALGLARLTPRARLGWIRVFGVLFPTACVIVYCLLPKPVTLILLSGVMQALLLPMLGAAALVFRYRHGDPRLAPSRLWDLCLWLSFAAFLVVGVYLAYSKLLG